MTKEASNELDAINHQIIGELQRDGRASFREIGKRLGIAPGTVRTRYNQLRKAGIVEVIAVPNPWRMGMDFHATVGLQVKPGSIEGAVAVLADKREVGWIGLVLSGYDIMFEVALSDSHAFGSFKESLWTEVPGFISADVYALWDVRKFHYELGPATARNAGVAKKGLRRSSGKKKPVA